MRILIVNPNTSTEATAAFVSLARQSAAPGTEIVAATGGFGAKLMRTPAETAIGTHAALEAIAQNVNGCDAVVVAAFGDYGASAARPLVDVPVLSIADAAYAALRLATGRFAILTVAAGVAAMLRRDVVEQGLIDRLTGIHAAEVSGSPEQYRGTALLALQRVLDQDRPDAVLAVGPPLAPLIPELRSACPVPVIEGVACAVKLAEALVALGMRRRAVAGNGGPVTTYNGLTPALEAALVRATS